MSHFILWFKPNFKLKSSPSKLTMPWNSIWLNFIILRESFINKAMFTLHNKTQLWRGNISISLQLLEHCKFNLVFLLFFGVIVFSQLCIWSIGFLHPFYKTNPLMKFCLNRFHLILILELLAIFALPLMLVLINTSFPQELGNLYS